MKNLKKTIALLFAIGAMTFMGCSSDDDGNTNNGGANGSGEYVRVKIDGVDWSASTSFDTTGGTLSTTGSVTVLVVQGSDEGGNAINFTIANYDGPGTYTTGDSVTNTNLIQYLSISPVAGWASNVATSVVGGLTPGSITVTSDDNGVVIGTFSFDGYNANDMSTKVFTEGEFRANLDN